MGDFPAIPQTLDFWIFLMHSLEKSTEVQVGEDSFWGSYIGGSYTEPWRE